MRDCRRSNTPGKWEFWQWPHHSPQIWELLGSAMHDGMCSTASGRWEALHITIGGWWDVQRHTIMMGIVNWCHGRMSFMCSATPWRLAALSGATGGGWDVQHHAGKMGVIELYHEKTMGFAAPRQEDRNPLVVPWKDDGMCTGAAPHHVDGNHWAVPTWDDGMCRATQEKWLSSAMHGRMKGCAAPHQEDGMCSATQEKLLSSTTGGWKDVQHHTKKMGCAAPHKKKDWAVPREDEWRLGVVHRRGDEECTAWFGINYSNYREKTSPNDLWRCMVAITSCTTPCLSPFHYSLQGEKTIED